LQFLWLGDFARTALKAVARHGPSGVIALCALVLLFVLLATTRDIRVGAVFSVSSIVVLHLVNTGREREARDALEWSRIRLEREGERVLEIVERPVPRRRSRRRDGTGFNQIDLY